MLYDSILGLWRIYRFSSPVNYVPGAAFTPHANSAFTAIQRWSRLLLTLKKGSHAMISICSMRLLLIEELVSHAAHPGIATEDPHTRLLQRARVRRQVQLLRAPQSPRNWGRIRVPGIHPKLWISSKAARASITTLLVLRC